MRIPISTLYDTDSLSKLHFEHFEIQELPAGLCEGNNLKVAKVVG